MAVNPLIFNPRVPCWKRSLVDTVGSFSTSSRALLGQKQLWADIAVWNSRMNRSQNWQENAQNSD
jgi:hypothetical protein